MVKFKPIPTLTPNQQERFWKKVVKTDSCWLWQGCLDTVGYGQVCFSRSEGGFRAHRVALSIHKDIGTTLEVAHSCGNRRCVNPDHLRLATRLENNREKELHGTKLLGSKTAKAKLKESDIPVIRELCKTKMRKEVASLYGVTPGTISAICTGRCWSHIQ